LRHVSWIEGKSEAWVQDRTRHKSSTMIAKYRRAARMPFEVGMGPFVRMGAAWVMYDEYETHSTRPGLIPPTSLRPLCDTFSTYHASAASHPDTPYRTLSPNSLQHEHLHVEGLCAGLMLARTSSARQPVFALPATRERYLGRKYDVDRWVFSFSHGYLATTRSDCR